MNKKYIGLIVAVVLVVGAGMFYGGMRYERSKQSTDRRMRSGAFMGPNGGGAQRNADGVRSNRSGGGGDFLGGEILAKDDKSITVKTRDGGSKIIYFSETTSIGKATDGTAADLETGKQVMITGKSNPDGSVTAQNIQIRPPVQ